MKNKKTPEAKKPYEHKDGFGSMFKNKDYQPEGNKPYFTGTVKTPSGELLNIACWNKKSEKGLSYMSIKLSEPSDSGNGDEQGVAPITDDLPF